jgi:hypothetical protein
LILFVVSFAIVAVFWYGHQMEMMHWIIRSDRVHLGITLAFLFMISFVPLSASLRGENHALPLAASSYGANYFSPGSFAMFAGRMSRMVPGWWCGSSTRSLSCTSGADSRSCRALPLIAAALSRLNTIVAIAAFVLIPLLYVKPTTRHLT